MYGGLSGGYFTESILTRSVFIYINVDISFEYRRNDEFSYLIDTYKNMLDEIKQLIDQLYISEQNKREAEIKALQAQINPHFLYNTLDSVNWLALKYNAVDISTMVTSLSDFFRYTLSKGKNIIPLSDEKKQIESYLAIQKIRFMDKLDYNINFPQELLDYLTVKLILQPIVENSIIHGIEKKRGKGIVDITAEKTGGKIEIRITDNGVGGNIEEMNSLLNYREGIVKSYGIRNVNERIKQLFGVQYGIRFYSNEELRASRGISMNNESGVTALITIPAVKKWRA
jgi:two-component system sensor histidine kinase YesM